MNDSKPLVSCIIPVYNGERYLRSALESIFAQDYRPIEVMVVDDGSNDNSAAIALDFKDIRYIHQTNQGVAAARNVGITTARGEFIAFLDQDDLWTSDKLSTQIEHLLKNPEVQYSLTEQQFFLEPGMSRPAWFKKKALLEPHAGYGPGTLIVRKSLFNKIGEFAVEYKCASDSDWLFRANAAAVPMAVIPKVLLHKRIHDANESSQAKLILAELRRVVKDSIDRHRTADTPAVNEDLESCQTPSSP